MKLKTYEKTTTATTTTTRTKIAIHILPNISTCKGNQKMKFGQLIELIECNMRKILLEKSYTNCGGETITRHFSKKAKLS